MYPVPCICVVRSLKALSVVGHSVRERSCSRSARDKDYIRRMLSRARMAAVEVGETKPQLGEPRQDGCLICGSDIANAISIVADQIVATSSCEHILSLQEATPNPSSAKLDPLKTS